MLSCSKHLGAACNCFQVCGKPVAGAGAIPPVPLAVAMNHFSAGAGAIPQVPLAVAMNHFSAGAGAIPQVPLALAMNHFSAGAGAIPQVPLAVAINHSFARGAACYPEGDFYSESSLPGPRQDTVAVARIHPSREPSSVSCSSSSSASILSSLGASSSLAYTGPASACVSPPSRPTTPPVAQLTIGKGYAIILELIYNLLYDLIPSDPIAKKAQETLLLKIANKFEECSILFSPAASDANKEMPVFSLGDPTEYLKHVLCSLGGYMHTFAIKKYQADLDLYNVERKFAPGNPNFIIKNDIFASEINQLAFIIYKAIGADPASFILSPSQNINFDLRENKLKQDLLLLLNQTKNLVEASRVGRGEQIIASPYRATLLRLLIEFQSRAPDNYGVQYIHDFLAFIIQEVGRMQDFYYNKKVVDWNNQRIKDGWIHETDLIAPNGEFQADLKKIYDFSHRRLSLIMGASPPAAVMKSGYYQTQLDFHLGLLRSQLELLQKQLRSLRNKKARALDSIQSGQMGLLGLKGELEEPSSEERSDSCSDSEDESLPRPPVEFASSLSTLRSSFLLPLLDSEVTLQLDSEITTCEEKIREVSLYVLSLERAPSQG